MKICFLNLGSRDDCRTWTWPRVELWEFNTGREFYRWDFHFWIKTPRISTEMSIDTKWTFNKRSTHEKEQTPAQSIKIQKPFKFLNSLCLPGKARKFPLINERTWIQGQFYGRNQTEVDVIRLKTDRILLENAVHRQVKVHHFCLKR